MGDYGQSGLPAKLGVDEESIVDPLKSLLEPLGIYAGYYAPPSDEEAAILHQRPPPSSPFQMIENNTRVTLLGLAQAPHLNGANGRVLSYDSGKQRYAVALDAPHNKTVALKEANLSTFDL